MCRDTKRGWLVGVLMCLSESNSRDFHRSCSLTSTVCLRGPRKIPPAAAGPTGPIRAESCPVSGVSGPRSLLGRSVPCDALGWLSVRNRQDVSCDALGWLSVRNRQDVSCLSVTGLGVGV